MCEISSSRCISDDLDLECPEVFWVYLKAVPTQYARVMDKPMVPSMVLQTMLLALLRPQQRSIVPRMRCAANSEALSALARARSESRTEQD